MHDKLRTFKAGVFQALSHPSRIAIVELLRDEGEVPVSAIHERLGLGQANVSQHLSVLRSRSLLTSRREGNQVLYSLRDRAIGDVLDRMRDCFYSQLSESQELLRDLQTADGQQVQGAAFD